MEHLMHLLISAVVILIGLYLFSWLSTSSSSPLAGKI